LRATLCAIPRSAALYFLGPAPERSERQWCSNFCEAKIAQVPV